MACKSPINLSQSISKPCDLLCELIMDDVQIASATVLISGGEGLVLMNQAGLGTCKFNGEGYTCTTVAVFHPSMHTIENIQADGEVVAYFTSGSNTLCVSSLFRVNSAETQSVHFFNSFIPYASPGVPSSTVNLGENWSLPMMVPPQGSYYVYDGSTLPTCTSSKWVVFKSMINIDPNVFALLVKNTAPTNISIQNLSDQNLYFNDISVLPGSIMPHDNKTYMRCKRVGSKPTVGTVTPAPLLASKPKQSMFSGIQKQISETGIFPLLDVIILVLSLCIGLYYGYSLSNSTNVFYLLTKSESFASYVRSFFVRPTNI